MRTALRKMRPWVLGMCAAWVGASCTPSTGSFVVQPRQAISQTAWAGFVLPVHLPPIEAQGRMQLRLKKGITISNVTWQAWPNGSQRLLVLARITGFLAFEARWNETHLMVIDYANQQRALTLNTPEARRALLQFDVPPAQWYMLFTGRIGRRVFRTYQGQRQNDLVTLTQAGPVGTLPISIHRIELGGQGLPVSWLRQGLVQPKMQVEYLQYDVQKMSRQFHLRLPKRVHVFLGSGEKPALILVLRQFKTAPPHPQPFFEVPSHAKKFSVLQP